MKVFIGCSGWNYKDWRGKFYPEKLAQKNWLEFYAKEFNTVEVNNTFYRFPRDSSLLSWKDTAPEGFRFTLKGSRYVTHMKKLKEVSESVDNFHNAAALLEEKLSCILWQLPPNLHRNDEKLKVFCETLNPADKNVIEFRHLSWFDSEVYSLLSKYGVSFCSISSPEFPDDMITTSEIGYVRFHGEGKNWYDYYYAQEQLEKWHHKILNSGVKEVYVNFNNDIGANAVENAKQLKGMFN